MVFILFDVTFSSACMRVATKFQMLSAESSASVCQQVCRRADRAKIVRLSSTTMDADVAMKDTEHARIGVELDEIGAELDAIERDARLEVAQFRQLSAANECVGKCRGQQAGVEES